ncbi:Calcineurin-like phosphoesterase [Streptomyces sp. SolWspMP-sol7th]|nr:Calcineurin-like phosphoesterase [Streptomyces sp. SolWspMP-sol7th]
MLLAHLSDLHLDGTERAAARARAAVDRVRAAGDAVDALLVTGDLADHGAESEYEEVAAVLAGLPFPVLTCPGNHDERRAYRKVLRDGAPGDGPIDELHVLRRDGAPALAVLMCDSSIPGAGAGALSPETLAWIDTSLTALPDEVPAVLAFHHPRPASTTRSRTASASRAPTTSRTSSPATRASLPSSRATRTPPPRQASRASRSARPRPSRTPCA